MSRNVTAEIKNNCESRAEREKRKKIVPREMTNNKKGRLDDFKRMSNLANIFNSVTLRLNYSLIYNCGTT